jgi:hypothetical protein
MHDKSLIIANDLLKFEEDNIKKTRFIYNEFEYGISVCLLCRTLITLNKKS